MQDSTNAVRRLSEILEQEQRCLDDLAALFRREQDAIRLLSCDDLAEAGQRKLGLLSALRRLEEQRASVTGELAADWDLPADSLTLTTIADRVEPEWAGRLARQRDRLNRSVLAAHDANDVSRLMLDGSLALVEDSLALFQRTPPSPPLYSQAGQLAAASVGGSLLARKG